jgi:hypothetical protein
MTNVRYYYDPNITKERVRDGERLVSLNYFARDINMIDESSSKCDILMNHMEGGSGTFHHTLFHFCLFYFSFEQV